MGLRFILCGSSARKLQRGQSNLLGGRVWRYEMFPLVTPELERVDMLRALNHGMVPVHYLQNDYKRSLKAYVRDYLKDEVFHEGLTRNLPAFSRFFDAMGYSHGELVNYSNIARDCGVDSKTVKEYFQILVDTLLGGGEVAIEVKGTSRVDNADLRSLNAFVDEYAPRLAIAVCNAKAERSYEKIKIMPWRTFLRGLWEGKIIH